MKKVILAAAALLIVASASAQVGSFARKHNFEWGVKGGLNVSGITNGADDKMKASIYVGAFAEFSVNDWFGVQPEVVYSRQGFAGNVSGTELDYVRARLNYLNIPVMGKFYVLERLNFETGPQFGFLLNSQLVAKSGDTKAKKKMDGVKNFDLSWSIGLSYRICKSVDATFRYNIGLTKLDDSENNPPKNNVIQIGAGYRF